MKKKQKTLQELTIMDGFLFGAVMTDPENCRILLERILETPIERVTVVQEKTMVYHPEYKGIRLDVYARDEKGRRFDVEVQIRKTQIEKRSRYYHSQMDMEMLLAGMPYEMLPESYVIFICDHDPFGRGKYRYRMGLQCKECPDMEYYDGIHTIILNNRGRNPEEVPDELVSFLEFTKKKLPDSEEESDDAYIGRLQDSIRQIKSSREMGERYMSLELWLQDERKEGRKEGREEAMFQLVGEEVLSVEKGAEMLGISIEEFERKMDIYLKEEA